MKKKRQFHLLWFTLRPTQFQYLQVTMVSNYELVPKWTVGLSSIPSPSILWMKGFCVCVCHVSSSWRVGRPVLIHQSFQFGSQGYFVKPWLSGDVTLIGRICQSMGGTWWAKSIHEERRIELPQPFTPVLPLMFSHSLNFPVTSLLPGGHCCSSALSHELFLPLICKGGEKAAAEMRLFFF